MVVVVVVVVVAAAAVFLCLLIVNCYVSGCKGLLLWLSFSMD